MILIHENHRIPENDGLCSWPNRLAYMEVAPEAVVSRMAQVEADVTRSLARRARYTRDHLKENGLDFADVGLTVDNPDDDKALVTAVVALQMDLFPGDQDEQDGMYGSRTFEAYVRKEKRDDLRAKVEQARLKSREAEGAMVQHDSITPEIIQTYGITAEVIAAAEKECEKNGTPDEIIVRENFVRLVDYAARVTDVPPAAIVATVYAETSGDFNPTDYGSVDELGMGQFLKKYWDEYRNDALFQREMAKFTAQDPKTIGRARSLVADLLAIGIKLKKAERVTDAFHYDTQLTPDQLFRMRFHYHAPGYAAVYYGKADRGPEYAARAKGAYERYGSRYQKRFADKAGQTYAALKEQIDTLHA